MLPRSRSSSRIWRRRSAGTICRLSVEIDQPSSAPRRTRRRSAAKRVRRRRSSTRVPREARTAPPEGRPIASDVVVEGHPVAELPADERLARDPVGHFAVPGIAEAPRADGDAAAYRQLLIWPHVVRHPVRPLQEVEGDRGSPASRPSAARRSADSARPFPWPIATMRSMSQRGQRLPARGPTRFRSLEQVEAEVHRRQAQVVHRAVFEVRPAPRAAVPVALDEGS